MTDTPPPWTAPPGERDADAPDPEATLGLLTDDTARTVFESLDEPMTAKEVADACDIGLSTAYRKLDALSSLGLCRERLVVRPDGHHVTEHVRAVEEVRVAVGSDGFDVDVTRRRTSVGGVVEGYGHSASD